ncbi:MAG: hypothetical protein ACE5EC_03065, partial [Phycisphaerae bacterium]
ETEIDLVDVKRRIYRGFLLSHPLRTLRIASRMDLRVLSATAVSFARENLLAAGKKARSGRDRRSVRGLQPAGSSA